ncbi:CCA tRNA nucleotidyltransferase [Metabacillus iocasae]|uniref:CCA-adding enzyme n=1 Tax=Priestia iocasae TaxID=2291674 RepID=A0ABS2QV47_9BACI|nr:CCA tRNA nucleotidyltransferase [Metabacillus iocasae]MBM7703334.1 tRNA nucleotidyltransferase (CCA-adding enzyme) [Metabacillus iocasae]
MREPFIQPLTIIKELEQHGYEAYFVGGAVRDSIIGREIGDVDIATSAKPKEVMALFPKTIDVGIEHGTVVVLYKGEPYEVTTFRTEGTYEDFRRPSSVQFISSLKEDLQRRDFTINAIAMNRHGDIIDPFNGIEAIEKKVIVTVGEASERFHEDALRMMRAIRFVSQLSFTLEEETRQAIRQHGSLLQHVSVERITVEFEKMLQGDSSVQAFSLLAETKLYSFLPSLQVSDNTFSKLLQYKWHLLQHVTESWALLLIGLHNQQIESFLKNWKLSNKTIKEVRDYVSAYTQIRTEGWSPQLIYTYGVHTSLAVNRICYVVGEHEVDESWIKQVNQELPIHSLQDIVVNGADIMNWLNKKGGPWLSELLRTMEQSIVSGELKNDKDAIREWVQSCNQI